MTIEYDGTDFYGWQKQPGGVRTVQGEIEAVLARVLQEPVKINGAGRTDSGVHARGQVANFRTGSPMSPCRLSCALNGLLPPSIRIRSVDEAPDTFHARFSALGREYRYVMTERPTAFGRYAGCCREAPDIDLLNRCSAELLGKHDFSVFSRDARDGRNAVCAVYSAVWGRGTERIVFRISANRFLRTMVRFLVSALLCAREGDISACLRSGVLPQGIVPADPSGLFLWRVHYP